MSEKDVDVYIGKGGPVSREDYIDFINYVFGFNGVAKSFDTLLPKLYTEGCDPVGSSYIAMENGRIKAAIGAFSHTLEVCGTPLSCRGIGNVAVHPSARSRGYMKATLGMAMDEMVEDGVDLSILGGLRARYNYFSFEREGTTLHFRIGAEIMRHRFGTKRTSRFSYRQVKRNDEAILDEILKLSDAQIFKPVRPREQLFDILTSWTQVPYAVYEGDRFVGYFILGDGGINETQVVSADDYLEVIIGAYDHLHKRELVVSVPPFRPDFAKQLYTFCESYDVMCSKMYSVLCYERVISAFLRLKNTYETLPDGELVLLIHGRGGEEQLLISVKDGVPSVEKTDRAPDVTLEHIEAMSLIFAPYCPDRIQLPSYARVWFPLPLYIYYSDAV